jgi:hypothetical protein
MSAAAPIVAIAPVASLADASHAPRTKTPEEYQQQIQRIIEEEARMATEDGIARKYYARLHTDVTKTRACPPLQRRGEHPELEIITEEAFLALSMDERCAETYGLDVHTGTFRTLASIGVTAAEIEGHIALAQQIGDATKPEYHDGMDMDAEMKAFEPHYNYKSFFYRLHSAIAWRGPLKLTPCLSPL